MSGFYKTYTLSAVAIICGILGFFVPTPIGSIISFAGAIVGASIPLFFLRRVSFLEKEIEVKTGGFSALAENMGDGVLIYDPDFKIITLNGAAEKILEIDRNEIIGKKIEPRGFSGEAPLFFQVLFPSLAINASQLSEGDAWPRIVAINTKNKRIITTATRVLKDGGLVSYFIKILRDETQEKYVAEDKEEFISVAAHQLRTPLTSINWALDSIIKESGDKNDQIKSTAEEALRVSERTLKIINDLLDVAKMENGTEQESFSELEIVPFLKSIIETAEPFAKERSVSLFFAPIPPEWEGVVVRADQQLGNACANLLDNAIKYNIKNGEVTVRLEAYPEKNMVKVSIEDTGIGISKEDFSRLFGKFVRGSNIQTKEPDGSGLGLYIVKKIIEKHGGKVSFSSREGRGSVFSFTLPSIKK